MKLIECVPNISEGRDLKRIRKIATSVESIDGVKLLHIDPSHAANRTVITFAGPPEKIVDAAFELYKVAYDLIDMTTHNGIHPRMGAVDVSPFVPIQNTTMVDAKESALKLAACVGTELKIPTFLYGESASRSERRDLTNIRKGEYEGFEKKLADPHWKPDFGPNIFNRKFGVTAIGARPILIALNVNLDTTDIKIAKTIAGAIRESGSKGKPGLLKHVNAIGWVIDEFECAQVSMNLTNYKQTPPHIVYDVIKERALEMGHETLGSELVGLIPKEALLDAGTFCIDQESDLSESELIENAIHYLGLNDVKPFHPALHILENCIATYF